MHTHTHTPAPPIRIGLCVQGPIEVTLASSRAYKICFPFLRVQLRAPASASTGNRPTGGVWQARLTRQPDGTKPHRAGPQLCVRAHVPGADRPITRSSLACPLPDYPLSSVSPHRPPQNNDRPRALTEKSKPRRDWMFSVARRASVTITGVDRCLSTGTYRYECRVLLARDPRAVEANGHSLAQGELPEWPTVPGLFDHD